jgi:hypothetical protein
MKEINYNNRIYTAQDIANMRQYLNTWIYVNYPVEFIEGLSCFQVLNAVNDYYYNGVEQFNKDQYSVLAAPFMNRKMVISACCSQTFTILQFPLVGMAKVVKTSTWNAYKASLEKRGVLYHKS